MFSGIVPAPAMRPAYNVGFPWDIPTGRYHIGAHGELLLNGGILTFTGIGGQGNIGKSLFAHHLFLTLVERYAVPDPDKVEVRGLSYDTEPPSISPHRFQMLSKHQGRIGKMDPDQYMMFTDSTVMTANKFFKAFKDGAKSKTEDKKSPRVLYPFINKKTGQRLDNYIPNIIEIDSLSMMTPEVVDRILDENEIGESGANIEAMKGQAAKTQMITQMPDICASANICCLATAHLGKVYQLDPRAPLSKTLAFLKADLKFKRVPENFGFLTTHLWFGVSGSPLKNRATGAPEFPRSATDNMEGDTDLMRVSFMLVRSKNGPSGHLVDVIVSQSDGILPHLTALLYLKDNGGYGLGGNDRSYYVEFLPDTKLSRTTARGKIDSDEKLRRALEIAGEMCQMKNYWHGLPDGWLCTPKELYDDLKAKGYDWDQLLDTRGWWTWEGTKGVKNYLSTGDLLNMRAGLYHPFWMKDKPAGVKVVTGAIQEIGGSTAPAEPADDDE